MLFNSLSYAIFLPIVFILYWSLPHKYRWLLLFAASYYFYMSWNVKYVFLIAFTTIVSYFAALGIEKSKDKSVKKIIIGLTLISCLGVLFIFKYFNFFAGTIFDIAGVMGIKLHPVTLNLLLPVGISFYTFQTLSYVIDVYRGSIKAERNLGIYATFVSFFPQLVAGPIERTSNLLPQIKKEHTFNYEQTTYGLKLMAWGFFKKIVIADNFSPYADQVFNNIYSYRGFSLILAAFLFTIQIYCDFSGYSDIARGTAKLLGIELMVNFKSPYFATSIHEFWSRWHISLSTWFKDYVYIPLGGNRVSKLRNYLNLLITFLVSGLWHGANWTFVLWGGIHGMAQIIENATGIRKRKSQSALMKFFRTILVFAFAMLAWVFFRSQNMNEAIHWFKNAFYGISNPMTYIHDGLAMSSRVSIGIEKTEIAKLLVFVLILAVYDYNSLKTDVIAYISKLPAVPRHLIYCALILVIVFFHAMGEVSFVYFQF